jgi:hypothetical protein
VNCNQSSWQNLSGDFKLTPERHWHPSSLSDLVQIVQQAEAAEPPRKVHAAGSSWSLSDAPATPDYLVETKALHASLYDVIPHALREDARLALTAQPSGQRHSYYHVEAGITIHELCRRLDQPDTRWPLPTHDLAGQHPVLGGRWALATMGGASGQTLAGAISTGTHGSDVQLQPMADFVEAVHLVGPGGRQHWIERSSRPLTDDEALRSIYPEIAVHHDDDLFNSVLVSIGRMGIIYSLVIKVVPQFGLEERRHHSIWSKEVPRLLDGTIFSGERFVQVVLSPYATSTGEHVCYVTTRREIPPPTSTHGSSMPAAFNWICRYQTIGQLLVHVVSLLLLAVLPMRFIPGARRLVDRVLAIIGLCVLVLLPVGGASLGDLVARLCNAANAARQAWITTTLAGRILAAGQRAEGTAAARPRTGIGYQIAEDTGVGVPCYRGETVELFFDAAGTAHTDFVNEDLLPTFDALRRQEGPVLGYVSLRFTGRSDAYLAMQQWDRTCSIEVALLKGVNGNDTLLRQLERAALLRGGSVHWGQGNTLTAADVSRMYSRYDLWREQLRFLSADGGLSTFENSYCEKRGLVP